MMDFYTMKKTCEQLTKDEYYRRDLYRIKVGNDIIEVISNLRYVQAPKELEVTVKRHYIGKPDNTPTNSHRTAVLQSAVLEYFYGRLLGEMEDEIREISKWSSSITRIKESYWGKHFHFIEGATARDVLNKLCNEYSFYRNQALGGKDFFDILEELYEEYYDGFLLKTIQDVILWMYPIDNV